jgi:hypothetical protein
MINKLWDSGLVEAKYIGVDSSFGRDHNFLCSMPKELIVFADIPCNHLVFIEKPEVGPLEYKGRGRKSTRLHTSHEPVSVKSIAANEEIPWQDVILGTGSKGPIIARDKCILVWNTHNGLPTEQVWLYIREKEDGSIKYALCNDSQEASIEDIRKPALMRWSIEQSFRECKTTIGLDHYETRSWIGWRRHILLCLIAHLFILTMRLKFTTKRDYELEIPIVTSPVSLEEFLEAVEQHDNKEPVNHASIQFTVKAPHAFMTIGEARDLVCGCIRRITMHIKVLYRKISNYSASFNSFARGKLKMLQERKMMSVTL